MKIVFVSSKYRGDVEKNVADARRYCKMVIDRGFIPVAPHLIFTQFLSDDDPKERDLGIQMGLELLKACCEEAWFFGTASAGMATELSEAKRLHLPIKWFRDNGEPTPEMEEVLVP